MSRPPSAWRRRSGWEDGTIERTPTEAAPPDPNPLGHRNDLIFWVIE
jgi:hypothetical protein